MCLVRLALRRLACLRCFALPHRQLLQRATGLFVNFLLPLSPSRVHPESVAATRVAMPLRLLVCKGMAPRLWHVPPVFVCASPASPHFESDRTLTAQPRAALPRLPLQRNSPPESTPSRQDHFEAGPPTEPANAFSSPGLPATHFESDLHTPTHTDPFAVGTAAVPRLSPRAASMNTARLAAHAADFAYANPPSFRIFHAGCRSYRLSSWSFTELTE